MKNVLAIDFGASSGRAVIGSFDGTVIKLTEIHRFSNDPVILGKTMYWDFLRLFHEIKQSLIKSKEYGEIDSIAIDTWGVDFGLIDKSGRLLENPVHYRDSRTAGTSDYSKRFIDHNRLYEKTGIQIMEINTAFQLLSIIRDRSELLDRADKMLMMPDLFAYYLGAKPVAEMSIASTTQLFDANTKTWSEECCERLKIKHSLLPEIAAGGTVVGTLSDEICKELDIKPAKIIAACGHDTQSAMVAVPASEKDFAFLSCGTWSLLGTELDAPVINEKSAKLNVSNETGYGAKTSFLKNIIGLWLIQESRRQWIREGKQYSFAELEDMARKAQPFRCFIDVDAPEFTPAGNIPERKKFSKRYMVGGGTKDKFLSELTADSLGIEVSSGPVEATSYGNIAIQLIADGEIRDIETARKIIAASEKLCTFAPENTAEWNKYYKIYLEKVK